MNIKHLIFNVNLKKQFYKRLNRFVKECIVVFYSITQRKLAVFLRELSYLIQGPLKKWTEHSQELYLLKIHSRGAPITPQGWMGVDFLDHELL